MQFEQAILLVRMERQNRRCQRKDDIGLYSIRCQTSTETPFAEAIFFGLLASRSVGRQIVRWLSVTSYRQGIVIVRPAFFAMKSTCLGVFRG